MSGVSEKLDAMRVMFDSKSHAALVKSDGFARIAAACEIDCLRRLAFLVQEFGRDVAAGRDTPLHVRKRVKNWARTSVDLATAVKLLRQYDAAAADWRAPGGDECTTESSTIERLIVELEFWYGTSEPNLSQFMGTHAGHRAFAIRMIDSCVPTGTVRRFSAIADLMQFAGYPGTTPELVRSTLARGKT